MASMGQMETQVVTEDGSSLLSFAVLEVSSPSRLLPIDKRISLLSAVESGCDLRVLTPDHPP
jgi:hypothetical protein